MMNHQARLTDEQPNGSWSLAQQRRGRRVARRLLGMRGWAAGILAVLVGACSSSTDGTSEKRIPEEPESLFVRPDRPSVRVLIGSPDGLKEVYLPAPRKGRFASAHPGSLAPASYWEQRGKSEAGGTHRTMSTIIGSDEMASNAGTLFLSAAAAECVFRPTWTAGPA